MVKGDVQLEGPWMLTGGYGCITLPQLHGMHQGPGVLPHLNGQHLSATCEAVG